MFNKIILSLILTTSFASLVSAQNRYDKHVPIRSTYKPQTYKPNTDILTKALDAKQSRYNNNREYLEGVINWVYDLKSSIRDEGVLQFLDKKSKELRLLETKDLSVLYVVIRDIEFQVKDKIQQYTREVEEQNIRRIQELEAEKIRLEQANKSVSSPQTNYSRTSPVRNSVQNDAPNIQEHTYDSNYQQRNYTQQQILERRYVTQATSFRELPDSKASVIKRFKSNDVVEVLDCSDTWWCKIRHQGRIGWVKKKLIEK